MPRYFLEFAYVGTAYNGLASQNNGNTIQDKINEVLAILYKQPIATTTSSRTDAGVHAKHNVLHFDAPKAIDNLIFKCNGMLPQDIAILNYKEVAPDAHSRFDATSRLYTYHISQSKDPFLQDRTWLYPFRLDEAVLNTTAEIIKQHADFKSFCKKHSDNFTTLCDIKQSYWTLHKQGLTYTVESNRFLRGMVRGLVATQLAAARGKISIPTFEEIIQSGDCTKAFFDAPGKGLILEQVSYT
jgi:tRNA pseudouridine38-40 synthase